MDYYTVARILKNQMTNVIVYGGFSHITYISYILKQLYYVSIDRVVGKCYTDLT